ncbi:hypothetical protein ACFS27_03200 [Promicromonospora vindobonensis]|uniref:Uncharacterized protein n=1 Tax=Promicromonospora vindobonensis TaxID=195748 RepID=A0ABW5VNM6_9MICO
MSANVTRRHAHTKGQPRRTWAPLGEVTYMLPVLDEPLPVLTEDQTALMLDDMSGDLFRAVRANVGNGPRNTQEVFEHLAPRHTPAKAIAHAARRVVSLGLYTVSVLAVIAVPPVLHGLGV